MPASFRFLLPAIVAASCPFSFALFMSCVTLVLLIDRPAVFLIRKGVMDRFSEPQLGDYGDECRRVEPRVLELARELEAELKSTRKIFAEFYGKKCAQVLNRSLEIAEKLAAETRLLMLYGLHPQHDITGKFMLGQPDVKRVATNQPPSTIEQGVNNAHLSVNKNVARNGAIDSSISTRPPERLKNIGEDSGAESPFKNKERSKDMWKLEGEHGGAPLDERRQKIQRREHLVSTRRVRCPGNDLDQCKDEWVWRKYGQKPILGTIHPRCYYRCSRSVDLGCKALKRMQKCEGDIDAFEITYIGEHICKSTGMNFMSTRASNCSPAPVGPASLKFLDPDDAFPSDSSLAFVYSNADSDFSLVANTGSSFSQFALPRSDVFLYNGAVGSTLSSGSSFPLSENGEPVLQRQKMHAQIKIEEQLVFPTVETTHITTSSMQACNSIDTPSSLSSQISLQTDDSLHASYFANFELFEENWPSAGFLSHVTEEAACKCADSRGERYPAVDSAPFF